ncbi:MAG: TVP38/TMEM64 family protein [Clostridia bacterium]|nr:TVP38/TMEM64 family protein [Clostridia bacterium]
MQRPDETVQYQKRRRAIAIGSLVIVVALFSWLTYFLTKQFLVFDQSPEEFKNFVEGYGWTGRFVALGIQVLQVIVSLIPGELVEVGIGYTFGAIEGTLLCMAGVAIASSLVFLLVKRLGIRLVELFISREKINELRFINSEKKLKRFIFILFFIPGTPKDLLTYFVGLTRIKLHEFLIISLIARIPSLVSSTIGGNLIQQKSYGGAVCMFVITGAISLAGMLAYNRIVSFRNRKKASNQDMPKADE